MKKILCIFRDGYDAEYLCRRLERLGGGYQLYYVLESGKKAKKAKIRRMLKRFHLFSFLINVFFLLLYDHDMTKRMKRILGDQKYPEDIAFQRIDDVNEERCIRFCNDLNPDLILIYGTGILKRESMEAIHADIYNIHSSILPYYRNVHSDFWAYKNRDFSRIGVTIFRLNAGIDTGDIALQKRAHLPERAALEEYKAQNLQNIPPMIREFLNMYFCGRIEHVKQDGEAGSVATTPTTVDIMNFWKKRRRSG